MPDDAQIRGAPHRKQAASAVRFDRALIMAAALTLAVPAEAVPTHIVWVELCDARHPGRRVPLPIENDHRPIKACHAGCGVIAARRHVRGRS
jgi:hypothetical protein